MNKQEKADLKIKIAIFGDKGVGKSNFAARFCLGTFSEFSNETVGVQLLSRKFWGPFQKQNQEYKVVFWDVGKEVEKNLLRTILKNTMGVIYMYDITKRQTFNNLQQYRNLFYECANTEHLTEMLIGNKRDLKNFREVSEEEGKKQAIKERIWLFEETTALLNKGIQEAMEQFLKVIISKFDQKVQRPTRLVITQPTHRGCL